MNDLLQKVSSHALNLDRAAFELAEASCILLIEPYAPLDDTGFKTVASVKKGAQVGRVSLERIKKREGANVFLTMVTVGRSRNNDIVLRHETVSKFHAFFTLGMDVAKTITITDAGSANGTFLNGKRLIPQTDRLPVASGNQVRLGDLVATFFTARGFWEYVRGGRLGNVL